MFSIYCISNIKGERLDCQSLIFARKNVDNINHNYFGPKKNCIKNAKMCQKVPKRLYSEKGKTPYRNRALLIFSGIHAENWNHESSSARFLSVRILSKN